MQDSRKEVAHRAGSFVQLVRGEDVVRRGISAMGIVAWHQLVGWGTGV